MQISILIENLHGKDNNLAYKSLLELEDIAEKSDELYEYMEYFFNMIESEKTYVRLRGFKLICKNAKWDTKNIINKNIDKLLLAFDDDKPTNIRQYLFAIKNMSVVKKELNLEIKKRLNSIDYSKYKDTMQGLIFNDAKLVLELLDTNK